MKLAVIGAGNMGSAIVRGLAKGPMFKAEEIYVSNPSQPKLDSLKRDFPYLNVTNSNAVAAQGADVVIIAVEPDIVKKVLKEIKPSKETILVSIAAGVSLERLSEMVPDASEPIFRVIPNTGIRELQSMNIISSRCADQDQTRFILSLFNETGLSVEVPESKMDAAMALTSCGIAYVFKYIQAGIQAGIELGLKPSDAQKMLAQTVKGAGEILLKEDTHPVLEIEKVCTPGGYTIKGVNELDHDGFSSAVIKAIKKCL